MRNSALTQVIYLIEDFDNAYQNAAWGPMIATAISSTQIVDGFFVKKTTDVNDTIEYLKTMHETIELLHKVRSSPPALPLFPSSRRWSIHLGRRLLLLSQNSDLYIIPDRAISRPTYLSLQKHLRSTHPTRAFLTSYADYATLNSKNGSTTLRDLWCKMLLTVSGLSPEKVSAIVEVYPTPISLWRAFKEDEEREEREREEVVRRGGGDRELKKVRGARELLTTGPGVGRRAIGKALAGKVYDLFRAEKYWLGERSGLFPLISCFSFVSGKWAVGWKRVGLAKKEEGWDAKISIWPTSHNEWEVMWHAWWWWRERNVVMMVLMMFEKEER
jgi:crossover junction endonuclease MUS81